MSGIVTSMMTTSTGRSSNLSKTSRPEEAWLITVMPSSRSSSRARPRRNRAWSSAKITSISRNGPPSAESRFPITYDTAGSRPSWSAGLPGIFYCPRTTLSGPARWARYERNPMTSEYRFMKACRREEVDATPVWMMRQAGRYLEEYRALRAQHSFLEMCRTPELAAEVTLQPMRRFDLDAAIIFADILLPLPGMGVDLSFAKGEGPVIGNPVRSVEDVDSLLPLQPEEHVPFLKEAIQRVRKELEGRAPLIGFSGAPFTLASYMIEGGGSKKYVNAKGLMYGRPDVWHRFMDKVSDAIISYLNFQVEAGVQAVQLFDSWVGTLGPADYQEYVYPHSQRILQSIDKKIPTIHFGTGNATLLPLMKKAGGDVIGVDWRSDLGDAWSLLGHDVGIQGNLDPVTLFAPVEVIESRVQRILSSAGNRAGHIFNLGHGILPQTPVEHAGAMIEAVHRLSAR